MSQDNAHAISLINASADALLARSKAERAACEAAEKRRIELQRRSARKLIDGDSNMSTAKAVRATGW